MKRRTFIKNSVALALASGVSEVAQAAAPLQSIADAQSSDNQASEKQALITSAPALQNFAETSIGIAFAVSATANGYVIYGKQPDLSDGKRVTCGGYRVSGMNDDVMQIRITGLQPATRYYYRIGADRINYKGGYDMHIIGNEEPKEVYSFTTAGKEAKAHFCVMNDTHARWNSFGMIIDKIVELAPSCIIWNGDAANAEEKIDSQKQIFLNPPIAHADYAACIPVLFTPGNHDTRGRAGRELEKVVMFRQPEERQPRDWDLGRNFAVRLGDVALIGLDTAEDKVDTNPKFCGLYNSHAYRKAQVDWLRDALKRPDIKSARHKVAICHIPLHDDNPKHNPGDVFPNDVDSRYTLDFAEWQREARNLWGPLLEKAGCELIITAHQHNYQYFAPTKDRPWAQIIGGGPDLNAKNAKVFPTVIECETQGKKLVVRIHNIATGKVQETITLGN